MLKNCFNLTGLACVNDTCFKKGQYVFKNTTPNIKASTFKVSSHSV